MICWYCHWGWPKVIADIYDEALGKMAENRSALHFGPAHVVWEDENFTSAECCLEDFEWYKGDYSEEELAAVRWSLEELAKIPMEIRNVAAEYEERAEEEDLHPDDFPPPEDMEMIRK